MSDTPERPDAPDRSDERWAKYERWREGDLQLPDPDALIGERGLGQPGGPTNVPWRALEGFAIFFIHFLAAAILTVPFAFVVEDQDSVTAIAILITELSLLATTWLWVRLRFGLGLRALGLTGWTGENLGKGLLVGVVGLFSSFLVGGVLTTVIESVTGSPPEEPNQIPLVGDPEGSILWVVGISVVILAPLAEELFFRGFVYAGLRRWARLWPALLWSALVFAIPHIEPIILPSIFVLGVFLAWITDRTRSIVPALVAHMAFNLFGFIALFLV